MKFVIDEAIPFILDRLPSEVEVLAMSGKDISPIEVKDADAIIVRTRTLCNKKLLDSSKVKLVATATIGTDHIDMEWCEKNGICVKNAPGCNAPGVAQYVFSSLFRTGFDPDKHTLGIIGYGNVGGIVGEWARQMGIRYMVSDPPREEKGFKDLEYYDLKTVLENCDAVTLHVPFNSDGKYPTAGLIGERELASMKPDSILVNSSRGGVVDEKALKDAIRQQGIKAVVDVWENEPAIDMELARLAMIATPHIAGYSEEGKKRGTGMVLQAVNDMFGINADITGLKCDASKDRRMTRQLIESSYNPMVDHRMLMADPEAFESIRNNYQYRHEPLFLNN